MNKSLLTNLIAAALLVIGLLLPESAARPYLISAGIFALSGALTNWLAVHMLFERVPGFYGSGVIAAKFEEFKAAIKNLVMDNFFTEENFFKFADVALHKSLTPEMIHEKVDLDELFNGFLEVVKNSKFGGMLSMFGGTRALEPLREPFKLEFERRLKTIVDSLDLTENHFNFETFRPTVESLVEGKLNDLKANDVKTILEKMMRTHLGWLVIWGGIVGALIGIASVPLSFYFQ